MLVKKKDFRSWKNISRIFSETLLKSQINLQKKLLMPNKTSNLFSLRKNNLAVLQKTKNKKSASLDEISSEVWKTKKLNDILLWLYNVVYKQNTTEK